MQDEGAGDELHLPGHRRLPPRPHLRMRRQLLRPGYFSLKLLNCRASSFTFLEGQSILVQCVLASLIILIA